MFADSQNGACLGVLATAHKPHHAAEGAQLVPDLKDVALDFDNRPYRHGPQVRDVQGAGDAHPVPEAGAGDETQRHRRTHVEDGGGTAAVHVPQGVAVDGLHGELEGNARVRRRRRVRYYREVWEDG